MPVRTPLSVNAAMVNSSIESDGSEDSSLRPFVCCVPHCTKSFRRRSALNEHAASHTGVKAFKCPVRSCKRSFSTSGNLSRHKRVQHPWLDKPLDCLVDDCGCSFASEAKLERHMQMVHFDASSHSCRVKHCGRAFCSAGNLRRHMKQQHSDETNLKTESRSPMGVFDHCMTEPASPPTWEVHRFEPDLLEALACLFD